MGIINGHKYRLLVSSPGCVSWGRQGDIFECQTGAEATPLFRLISRIPSRVEGNNHGGGRWWMSGTDWESRFEEVIESPLEVVSNWIDKVREGAT